MLGLGNNLTKGGVAGPTIISDGLVLKHQYDAGSVVPVSDGAAYFQGGGTDMNDYIALNGTYNNTSHSISAWIWVVDDSDNKTIFDYRDANNDGIHLYISDSEQLIYQINTEDALYAPVDLENKWHHVVATNDGTTSKIYLNGVLVETADTSGQTISTSAEARIGGRSHTSPSNYYQGYICNVGFWSGVLTQPQIKSIMWKNYAGLTDSEKTNLVSWWNLDTETNTSGESGTGGVKDSHGTNHGTLS